MRFLIARPTEGISLNTSREFLMTRLRQRHGYWRGFATKRQALEFVRRVFDPEDARFLYLWDRRRKDWCWADNGSTRPRVGSISQI